MRSKVLSFIVLYCLLTIYATAQNTRVYTDYDEAIKNPGAVYIAEIDCNYPENLTFIKNIHRFENMQTLRLISYEEKTLPVGISLLSNLEDVSISESPLMDIVGLFNRLAKLGKLKKLYLDDMELEKLPDEIVYLDSLTSLYLSNNDDLDLQQAVTVLQKMGWLKTLGLPVNQLTSLPDNIGSLSNLELLDLRNNYLSDLPAGMASMSKLDTLRTEENVIINPVGTFEKIKKLNIRYISLDAGISDEEKEILGQLFPNTQIAEINDIELSEPFEKDTVVASSQRRFGKLKIEDSDVRIYSTAYIFYPQIFTSQNFTIKFDSLSFEARYRDTTYVNFYKEQPNGFYNNIVLKKSTDVKNGFTLGAINMNVASRYFSELMAFNGYDWIYSGDLSHREFNKKFLNRVKFENETFRQTFFWRKPVYWRDVRIYFNETDMNFTIELKYKGGFETLNAYPLRKSNSSLEEAQTNYSSLYVRYMKTLDQRKKRLHRKWFSEQARLMQTLEKSRAQAWKDFCKMYMSPEERKMTQEEWLEYFDKIVSNEEKALYNAPATIEFLKRDLDREAYTSGRITSLLTGASPAIIVYSLFQDPDSNNLAVSKIIVINSKEGTYFEYRGDLGLDETPIYLDNDGNSSIVVEMRNGDIGVLKQDNFAKINFFDNEKYLADRTYVFTVEIIKSKLGSIGQLIRMLNL